VKATTNTPAVFVINGTKPGMLDSRELAATVQSESDSPVEVATVDNQDGTYTVTYTAQTAEQHMVTVKYQGCNLPRSPIQVSVLQEAKAAECVASGDCLLPEAVLLEGDVLIMDVATQHAGQGKLKASATGPDSTLVDVFMASREDGHVSVCAIPTAAGEYTLSVLWADEHIPQSPFHFNIVARLTASQMTVS